MACIREHDPWFTEASPSLSEATDSNGLSLVLVSLQPGMV
jgi:hypothetical protein